MNKEHWDNCIKEAIKMDMADYPQPDPERMWQRIESNVELFEGLNELPQQKKRRKLWLKVAAVLVVVVLCASLVGGTQVGEALPFGWVFQGLRQFATGDQTLVQFSFGGDATPAGPKTPPPEFDVTEMEAPQSNLTDTTLAELLDIYPGVLYYPNEISTGALKKSQYLQTGDMWIIMLDFSVDHYDILLRQQDIMGEGAAGMGFGADTEISFHRLDGVEYMVTEHRYGIVGVNWNKEHKLFDMTSNLPVEEALAVAQSVQPYIPSR